MQKKQLIAWGLGVLALVLVTAGASALVTREMIDEKPVIEAKAKTSGEKISWNEPRQAPQPAQPAKPACQDGNIVGKVIGGVGGGILGNQIGSGSGNTVATIGGAVGGTVLGGEYIPTDNVTCAK
jgi:uncharacterized protein YcfJ